MHGGANPKTKAKAEVRAEVLEWGLGDVHVDPGEVLLRLVSQSSRRADAYAAELAKQVTKHGDLKRAIERNAMLVRLEAEERDRLANFSGKAVKAGLNERMVRLAEDQAAFVARIVVTALERAGLDDDTRKRVQLEAMGHMRELAIEAEATVKM